MEVFPMSEAPQAVAEKPPVPQVNPEADKSPEAAHDHAHPAQPHPEGLPPADDKKIAAVHLKIEKDDETGVMYLNVKIAVEHVSEYTALGVLVKAKDLYQDFMARVQMIHLQRQAEQRKLEKAQAAQIKKGWLARTFGR